MSDSTDLLQFSKHRKLCWSPALSLYSMPFTSSQRWWGQQSSHVLPHQTRKTNFLPVGNWRNLVPQTFASQECDEYLSHHVATRTVTHTQKHCVYYCVYTHLSTHQKGDCRDIFMGNIASQHKSLLSSKCVDETNELCCFERWSWKKGDQWKWWQWSGKL